MTVPLRISRLRHPPGAPVLLRLDAYDRDALLADQLRWLHEAGFEDVDCVYKNYFVGVFYGRKGSR